MLFTNLCWRFLASATFVLHDHGHLCKFEQTVHLVLLLSLTFDGAPPQSPLRFDYLCHKPARGHGYIRLHGRFSLTAATSERRLWKRGSLCCSLARVETLSFLGEQSQHFVDVLIRKATSLHQTRHLHHELLSLFPSRAAVRHRPAS